MKILPIFLIVFFALSACTDFQETLDGEFYPLENLTPDHVKTQPNILTINIDVDQEEFNHMYKNYYDENDIYGTLSVYRNGTLAFREHDVRFRIKGGATRKYELKSLGIRFQEPVCNKNRQLIHPLTELPFHNLDKIESLRLRNSGNDFHRDRNGTMIKDISYTNLAIEAGMDIDLMYSEQAMVFLNNAFLGVMNLRSESNARGVAHKYGVNPGQITMAKVSPTETGIYLEIQDGDYQRVHKLMEAVENLNVNYVRSQMDESNLIDYVIFLTYIANRDWPHNNVKFYAVDQGRFRFIMFDLDHSNISHHNREPISFLERSRKNPLSQIFFLLYDHTEDFRQTFEDRYEYLVNNGYLSSEKFRSITHTHYKNIEYSMPYHIKRYKHPTAMVEWYRNIELLNVYFEKRENYIVNYYEP